MPGTIELGALDLHDCAAAPDALCGTCTIAESSSVYGLCGWFDAELTDSIKFGTGPADAKTHWQQLFFPFVRAVSLVADQPISIEIVPLSDPKVGGTLWRWSLTQGATKIEMDDFVHRAWLKREPPPGRLR